MSTLRLSGIASGMDTESMIKELMKAESQKKINVEKDITKLEWKKDIWEDINKKIYDFYTSSLQKMKRKSTYNQNSVSVSHENLMSVKANVSAVRGVHEFNITNIAKGSFLMNDHTAVKAKDGSSLSMKTSTQLSELVDFTNAKQEDVDGETKKYIAIQISTDVVKGVPSESGTAKEIKIYEDDSIGTMISKLNSYDGVKASFDENFNSISISSSQTGSNSKVEIIASELGGSLSGPEKDVFKTLFTNLGFSSAQDYNAPTYDDDGNLTGSEMRYQVAGVPGEDGTVGQDAVFTYNGRDFTNSDNAFEFNGLEINLKGSSTDKISVVVEHDAESIYNDVISFVEDYNKLITELNLRVNADKAKGYEPLTNEEKEAMSDDEVKLWEGRIKDSLLRRDPIIMSTLSFMRSHLGGKNASYSSEITSIAQIGIVTGGYTENGLLHIEGDPADSKYASKENKLKEAINDNPEEFQKFFSGLAEELYNGLTDKMASSKVSSAFTIYNDKKINSDIEDKKEMIERLEKRLIDVENRYYSQFTAMEQMMQRMNQQSASLMSMLGGSQ